MSTGGELIGDGPGGEPPYRVAFNDALGDCAVCGPASCKAAVLRTLRRPGDLVLVFGDGASDLCPAREADLTFARDHLAERCAVQASTSDHTVAKSSSGRHSRPSAAQR